VANTRLRKSPKKPGSDKASPKKVLATYGPRKSAVITRRTKTGETGIRTPGTGVNPYNGLANRTLSSINTESKTTYGTAGNCLSPDLSLRIQTDPELSSVVTAWVNLPPDVRKMIVGVVLATQKDATHQP
jgi:hypothetical protein